MLLSRGLRLAFIGLIVFMASGLTLLFLPETVAGVGMLVGGAGVWSGFLMTIWHYYKQ